MGYDIHSRNLPRSLECLCEVERVERVEKEELLVGGNRILVESRGRVGGVRAILMSATGESGNHDSGRVGNGQFLP